MSQGVDRHLLGLVELCATVRNPEQNRHYAVGTGQTTDLACIAVDEHRTCLASVRRPPMRPRSGATLEAGSDNAARAASSAAHRRTAAELAGSADQPDEPVCWHRPDSWAPNAVRDLAVG